MTFTACTREKELSGMVANGQWPLACPEELRAHVSGCRSCSELVLVSSALRTARADSAALANLPSPGVIWWRAQLRRRNAAIERVGRPILGAQIFALATCLLLGLGVVVSQARQGLNWLSWFGQLGQAQVGAFDLQALWPGGLFNSGWSLMVILPALATLAVVSGVVVYLASDKK